MDLNKVLLIGIVAYEPDVYATKGSTPMVTLKLLVVEKWRDRGGEERETKNYFPITAFGETAEYIQHEVHKGDRLKIVDGKLFMRQINSDDPKSRWEMRVKALKVESLDTRDDDGISMPKIDLPF